MQEKTVMITGCSSGIGRASAEYFHKKGCNVIAIMRQEKDLNLFSDKEHVLSIQADVTDIDSLERAVDLGIKRFNTIDVLVNNAGYGLVGAFEHATPKAIYQQYRVNVFGLMNMTRMVLPHFRERQAGVIVNISSLVGLITMPYYSIYTSSKWAVEGFSESLQFELEPLGIQVRLVEPGAVDTNFFADSLNVTEGPVEIYNQTFAHMANRPSKMRGTGSSPDEVAKVVFRAATSRRAKMRYRVNVSSEIVVLLRRLMPTRWFMLIVRRLFQ